MLESANYSKGNGVEKGTALLMTTLCAFVTEALCFSINLSTYSIKHFVSSKRK